VQALRLLWFDLISGAGGQEGVAFHPETLAFVRRHRRHAILPRLILTMGLVSLLTTKVQADISVDNIDLYDGANAPIVEIQYTGNSGVWVYGDAQTATNWTSANGSSIPLYCIDLTHENAEGDTYNLNSWSNPTFSTSSYSDATNRIAWAIEDGGLSGLGTAATQLVIWTIIDKGFSVINWNCDSALETAYTTMMNEMGNPSVGYNPNTNYLSGFEFLSAVHDPTNTLYQDLAAAVPEPSTLMIAGSAR
jgi:hypothetical protein